MVMKRKLFSICLFLLGMMAVVSCDSNEGVTTESGHSSRIVAYGINSSVSSQARSNDGVASANQVFSDENIEWFNSVSREIKFKNLEPSASIFPVYDKIEFRKGTKSLFTASSYVYGIYSQIFDDLVIYYDIEKDKYYLADCYPNTPQVRMLESVKQNAAKRASSWQEFLDVLKKENKLK